MPVISVIGAGQAGKTPLVQRLASDRAFISFDEEPSERAATRDPVGFVAALSRR